LTIAVRGTTSAPSTDDVATRGIRAERAKSPAGSRAAGAGARAVEAPGERRAHD